jgi:hypothetical protein
VPTTVLETVVDADDMFAGLLDKVYNSGRTPTLDRIDPYANVILSGPDVEKFVAEISTLKAYATSDEEKRQLAAIEALARRCTRETPQHHLHFVGD